MSLLPVRGASESAEAFLDRLMPVLNRALNGPQAATSQTILDAQGRVILSPAGHYVYALDGTIPVAADIVAIDTTQIVDAAVATAKLADGAVTQTKISNLAVGTAQVADAAIVTAKVGDLAVTTAKIADLAVNSAKIANLAVGSAQIDNAAVTTAKIANAAITNALIGSAAIASANIQNGAITNALIGSLAVGTANIQAAAITDAKINDLAATKITAGTLGAGVIYANAILAAQVTAGTFTGLTFETAASGARFVASAATNSVNIYDSGGNNTFSAGGGAAYSVSATVPASGVYLAAGLFTSNQTLVPAIIAQSGYKHTAVSVSDGGDVVMAGGDSNGGATISANGYETRAGLGAVDNGHFFNLSWDGSSIHFWIDGTNVKTI